MSETLGTVARALSVLTVIAEAKDAVGVKTVSAALNLPMSTSHRLLDLLLEAGFVEKDHARRRYTVGMEFLRLTNLVAQKASYTSLVEPVLARITSETGETAIYSSYLAAQRAMMYAAKSDSSHSLRFRVNLNQPMPLAWGASGLAILAFLPREIQTQVFAQTGPAPLSQKRLSQKAFFDRIEAVCRNGYAFTESEKLPDSYGIAVPVLNANGEVIGSITLTIPSIRFERSRLKEYAALLIREAGRFSGRAK